LGAAYAARGDFDRAVAEFTRLIQLDPQDAANLIKRGAAYMSKKDWDSACSDFSDAIRLAPEDGDAYSVLAWLWATCPEAKFRNGDKAVEYATKACQLTLWEDANQFESLAAAYAETGKFDEAVEWQTTALQSPDFPEEQREDAERRLKLYKEGKPHREQ
jgi:tetratricopeptide (TPR) repeat protein